MPRSPTTYSLPPGTTPQVPNTVISSATFNAAMDDIAQTFNTAQPVVYGGTGATNAADARDNLGLEIGTDIPSFPSVSGMLYGLGLSNNSGDPTNDIDIASGTAVNSTNIGVMTLASSITKRLDAVWAVGSGNGGLDTGAVGNNSYHVFLIKRPDTGVVDALFSLSATAPTLPANYTMFRRVGSIMRVSGAIRLFVQDGDIFIYAASVLDRNSVTAVASSLLTVSVPVGVNVRPILGLSIISLINGVGSNSLGSAATGSANSPLLAVNSNAGYQALVVADYFTSNTAAQIYFASVGGAANFSANTLSTLGFIDSRGK